MIPISFSSVQFQALDPPSRPQTGNLRQAVGLNQDLFPISSLIISFLIVYWASKNSNDINLNHFFQINYFSPWIQLTHMDPRKGCSSNHTQAWWHLWVRAQVTKKLNTIFLWVWMRVDFPSLITYFLLLCPDDSQSRALTASTPQPRAGTIEGSHGERMLRGRWKHFFLNMSDFST